MSISSPCWKVSGYLQVFNGTREASVSCMEPELNAAHERPDVSNRKQEYRARLWAYNKLVGLQGIISANQAGCKNMFETADYLGITEKFLHEAIQCYHNKYGQYTVCDNYIIYFEPSIAVLEFI